MITVFNRRNVYNGFDMKEFNRIRDMLDLHHIHYTYHVNNRLGQWAGEGTIRGRTGNIGMKSEETYQYELFVHRREWENAKELIKLPI